LGVLTHPERTIYPNPSEWEARFQSAVVHIQWDTERSIRGAALNQYSIQVGISRQLIREYVDEWIVRIEDMTPVVAKIHTSLKAGDEKNAKRLLPVERVYVVEPAIAQRIHIS
jgi:hypothetical protein